MSMDYYTTDVSGQRGYANQHSVSVENRLIGFIKNTPTGYKYRFVDAYTFRGSAIPLSQDQAVAHLWEFVAPGEPFPSKGDEYITHWELAL